MRLLVTGGAGFIGSAFIRQWMRENPNDQIITIDALTYAANLKALDEVADNPNYTFVKGSITDGELVRKHMKGVDVVVNFAAETHVDRSIESSDPFVQTNIIGTATLLDAARELSIKRYHQVSTDEVYGHLELSDPAFSETTPYAPRSPYAASKAAADFLVRSYFHTHGLAITISNCSNNYGPWQYPEKFIPVMVLKATRGEKLPIYGSGENIRDWIHVDDHAAGVALCITKGTPGETYCFGGNAERTNIDMARSILEILGQPKENLVHVTDRPGHDFRYAIDSSKAEKELAWSRKWTFEEGLNDTVQWYKTHNEALTLDERGVHTLKK